MPVGDLLPELILLLTAVAVMLAASFLAQRRQVWCAWLAGLGLLGSGMALVAQLSTPARLTFNGIWAIDGASIWARLIMVVATFIVVLLIPEWLRTDRRHGEYYAVLLFATLGALFMAGAADTMQLMIGVLLASITGYTLAAYHRGHDLSVEAGMKFFLVGALTNSLLLIGIVWLFGLAGSTDYREIGAALSESGNTVGWLVAAAFIVVGLAFKLGAVPAHTWMPEVAEGAPLPSAAYLMVIPKIGAALALARLGQMFTHEVDSWRALIAALAVASMTLGNLAALRQTDLRRLLGWSSVSQSGYALVAVAMIGWSPQALPALLIFLAAYAAANIAAFAVVTELRGRTVIDQYRGLASIHPWIMAVLTLALLSLVGIPPLAGFAGKLVPMLAAVEADYAWLAVVVVVNTVVSLFYYLRVIAPAYFVSSDGPMPTLGRGAWIALSLSGLLTVVLGLGAGMLLQELESLELLPALNAAA